MAQLDFLVEQLWAAPLEDERLRMVVDGSDEPGWRDLERYWLVPDAERATLLVPRGLPRVTAAAVGAYSGLRPAKVAAAKSLASVAARWRVPVSRHRLSIQIREGAPAEVARSLPLAVLEDLLGHAPLGAAIGVRTGDNRKPTLALFGEDGTPVGFAKLGWDPGSDEQVANETVVLNEIAASTGAAAVPAVLAAGEWRDHPVLVTAPLPADVRGGRRGIRPPTPHEVLGLMPLHRQGTLASTAHAQRLLETLQRQAAHALTASVADQARALLVAATTADLAQPISSRWHGDFTEWNLARDSEDRLWVWDWESSEPDVVAGLDALHWALSRRRLQVAALAEIDLAECVSAASPFLMAVGAPRTSWPIVAAAYVATVAERACALTVARGTWDESWIEPPVLLGLVSQARALLEGVSPAE